MDTQKYYIYGGCQSGDITGLTMGWYYASPSQTPTIDLNFRTLYSDGSKRDIKVNQIGGDLKVVYHESATGEHCLTFDLPSKGIGTVYHETTNGDGYVTVGISNDLAPGGVEEYMVYETEPNTEEWKKWNGTDQPITIVKKENGCNAGMTSIMLLFGAIPLLYFRKK